MKKILIVVSFVSLIIYAYIFNIKQGSISRLESLLLILPLAISIFYLIRNLILKPTDKN